MLVDIEKLKIGAKGEVRRGRPIPSDKKGHRISDFTQALLTMIKCWLKIIT